MERRVGTRQRWAWLAAAVSAPMAICACGLNWLWVLIAGLAATGYYIYMSRRLPAAGLGAVLRLGTAGRLLAALTLIWTTAAMAWAANLADRAFPLVDGDPVLGWTLLALAAWGSWKGSGTCARCSGVLCLFLLALYGVVVIFALPDVQVEQLRPQGNWQDGVTTLGLFLLPAAVWYAPGRREQGSVVWKLALLPPVAGALLAAVTAGVLTPALAQSLTVPLYTLAQSVSLFGVVERIEPLLSAAMVMGVFSLLSVMACACRCLCGTGRWGKWSGAVCCVAAGAGMALAGKIPVEAITVAGIGIWVVIPVVTVEMRRRKTTNSG